jgi:hypothetical protein
MMKNIWATMINQYFLSHNLGWQILVLNFLKFFTRWMDEKVLSYDDQSVFSVHNLGLETLVLNFIKFLTRWMIKKFWATIINPIFLPIFSVPQSWLRKKSRQIFLNFWQDEWWKSSELRSSTQYFLSHNRGSEIFVLNFLKFFTRWMMKKFWATIINQFFRSTFLA